MTSEEEHLYRRMLLYFNLKIQRARLDEEIKGLEGYLKKHLNGVPEMPEVRNV